MMDMLSYVYEFLHKKIYEHLIPYNFLKFYCISQIFHEYLYYNTNLILMNLDLSHNHKMKSFTSDFNSSVRML